MHVLVDGYNVLFALGLIPKQVKPGDLQAARAYLLNLLHRQLSSAKSISVVFDAANAPAGAPGDFVHRGIQVHFAKAKLDADDLIERLIDQASAPAQLVLVSADFRLRQAVQRRGGRAVRSEHFLAWLDEQARRHAPTSAPASDEPRPVPRQREDWEAIFSTPTQGDPMDADPLGQDDFLRAMEEFERRSQA